MGKPFNKEIEYLEKTYKWATEVDTSKISNAIKDSWSLPLLSVGSGGSYSAAELQVYLHRLFFSSICQSVTPIELITALPKNGEASVWFMSASGNNIDINRSFKHAALNEIKYVNALVGGKKSKLGRLSENYEYTNLFEFPIPSGKDGFLATNSLLAFSVILYSSYLEAANEEILFPKTLEELGKKVFGTRKGLTKIQKMVSPIWKKKALHVLYSPNLKAAALDIESKFVEAGLVSVHLADIRNFAHGRHHWFAKHRMNSGVIALSLENDRALTDKTLELLPDDVPKAHIPFAFNNGMEVIAGVFLTMYLTKWLGEELKIDPGRPGVPRYGSKIYRLSSNPGFITSFNKKEAAISRKIKGIPLNYDFENKSLWIKAYDQFVRQLKKRKISGIILDYDGTFVDSKNRFELPKDKIVKELIRLVKANVIVGFATGRGQSIRKDLQKVIPKNLWEKIIIGFYNGSEIHKLNYNQDLEGRSGLCDELTILQKKLKENICLTSLADFELRKFQITLKKKQALPENFLWDLVQEEIYQSNRKLGEVLRSSHSIDIVSKNATKLNVSEEIRKHIPIDSAILNIGDRGKWPGNDAALLSDELSLSVDEISYSSHTCWNLCPAGIKGAQGTLFYLSCLKEKKGVVRFNI